MRTLVWIVEDTWELGRPAACRVCHGRAEPEVVTVSDEAPSAATLPGDPPHQPHPPER